MLAAVNMRLEFDAFLLDFAEAGEAENLETAAIGQNGASQSINLCKPPIFRVISIPGRR